MLRTVPVEVKELVTVSQFESYMRPPGRPLIVRGWMHNWRSLSEWDFEFFKTNYGGDSMLLTDITGEREVEFNVTLSDYVDYILNPTAPSALKELETSRNRTQPFYCISYRPFKAHPELMEHVNVPPFVADWLPFFDDSFRQTHYPQDQGWLYLGGRNAAAKLHQDLHHTFTCLAQIRGRKACYLFSPEDSEAVYYGDIDPANPDLDKFPRLREATAHVCEINPGEILFLPQDWWHHIIALDNVITVSFNFVNHINLGHYLRKVYGGRLPDVLATLPDEPPPPSV